jgi:hypothetical protein
MMFDATSQWNIFSCVDAHYEYASSDWMIDWGFRPGTTLGMTGPSIIPHESATISIIQAITCYVQLGLDHVP